MKLLPLASPPKNNNNNSKNPGLAGSTGSRRSTVGDLSPGQSWAAPRGLVFLLRGQQTGPHSTVVPEQARWGPAQPTQPPSPLSWKGSRCGPGVWMAGEGLLCGCWDSPFCPQTQQISSVPKCLLQFSHVSKTRERQAGRLHICKVTPQTPQVTGFHGAQTGTGRVSFLGCPSARRASTSLLLTVIPQ